MASVELQAAMDEVSAPHLRLDPADNTYKHVQTKVRLCVHFDINHS